MLYLKNINIYTKVIVIFTSLLFFIFSCVPINNSLIIKTNNTKENIYTTELKENSKIKKNITNFSSPFQYIVNSDNHKENYNVETNFSNIETKFKISSNTDFTRSGELNLNGKKAFYVSNFKHERSYKINIKSSTPVIYSMYSKHGNNNWTLIAHYNKENTTKDSEFIFTYINKGFSTKSTSTDPTIVCVMNPQTLSAPPASYTVNELPNNTRKFQVPISTDAKIALATSVGILSLNAGETGRIEVEYDVVTGEKSYSFVKDYGAVSLSKTISLSGEISTGLTVEGKVVTFSFELVSSPEGEIYTRVCVSIGNDIKVFSVDATLCGTSEGYLSAKVGLKVFDTFTISATLFDGVHICQFLDNRGYIYLTGLNNIGQNDFINKYVYYNVKVPNSENLTFNLHLSDCDGKPLSMVSDNLDSPNSTLYYHEIDPNNFNKILVEHSQPIINDSSSIILNLSSINSPKTIKVYAVKTTGILKKTLPTYLRLEPKSYEFEIAPTSNEGNFLKISLIKKDENTATFRISKKDNTPFKSDTTIYVFNKENQTAPSNSIIDSKTILKNAKSLDFTITNKESDWIKNQDGIFSRKLYFQASNTNLFENFKPFEMKKYIYQGQTISQG